MARRLLEKTSVEHPGVEWAKRRGVVVTKGAVPGQNGWPDRVFWFYGGRPFLAELKSPGFEPAPLQAHRLKVLRELGYDAEYYDDQETFIAALEDRHRRAKALREKDDASRSRLPRGNGKKPGAA